MAHTPGRADTPRNEPLPFKSDRQLIWKNTREAGRLRTD